MTPPSRRNLLKCSSLFLGASLGLTVSGAATAQDAVEAKSAKPAVSYEQGNSILLPGVAIIGSKEAASTLPASGSFLSEEDLRKYNISDVNRAVRQVPGVYVREEDGYGLFPNISLRGVSTERMKAVTVMEDGILTAPAPYSAPSAYYSPNIGRMNGLEVLKGSSQIQYGPHITGGALNYISTPIPTEQTTSLRLSYGAYNELLGHLWHGDVQDLGDKGKVGYLVEGYYQSTDGFKRIDAAPDFRDTDNTGFTRVEPMVKLFWELPTSVPNRVELKYGFTDLDADETYLGLNDADFRLDPTRRYSASRFDNIQTQNHRTSLRHVVEPTDDLQIATTAYYQTFKRNWEKLDRVGGAKLGPALADTSAGGGLSQLRGDTDTTLKVKSNNRAYELFGVQSVATKSFALGDTSHELEAGIRYHFDEVDRFQWADTYGVTNGAVTSITSNSPGDEGDRIQQSRAIAIHAKDEIKWNRFTFVPGVRVEFIDQEFEDDKRISTTGTDGEGDMTAVGGGVSVAYELSDQLNVFGGVHRGFSIPAPKSAIDNGLNEETSLSFEIGSRYENSDKALYAEAIGFWTEFDNLIVGGNIGGGGSGNPESAGDITSRGLELAVGYDPGRANDWAFNTPLRLAVTLTDAHLNGPANSTDADSIFFGGQDGSKVPYVPEYQFNAEVGLEYGKVSTYLSSTYVPSTFTTASNVDSSTTDARIGKTDAYFVLDWTLRYQLRDTTTLFGGVKNILNREYIASRHPYGPRPGMPRFFNVGVEMAF